ncbi:MAG: DNA internalization-related competence protein ComEC/Rec2 [Thermoanaerobaculia bacterium]
MRDDGNPHIPAALPAIAFALGIVATAHLVAPRAAEAALLLCAALAAVVPRARRAAGLALFFALGIECGTGRADRLAASHAEVDARDADRFATVIVPLERGWQKREDVWRLRARSFVLATAHGDRHIDLSLVVTVWDEPAGDANARLVVAEGFLRCETEVCRMSVKSARLLESRGVLPRWHPAAWNRASAARLADLARASPLAHRGAAQAAALALGRDDLVDEEVREAYRRGGTYHLLVFSGMQIAFAAGLITFVFRRLGRPRPGDWALLALALLAPPFAGHDASVSRSAVMIGVYAASRILARPTPPANLLFVSAMIRLALFPGEIREPGFALTWGATGGLILLGGRWARRARRPLARALAYGAGAEAGTAAITAHFFHQVVIGSSVVTVVLSPLLSLMLALSAAAVVTAFAAPDLAVVVLELIGRFDHAAVAANEFVADRIGIARIVAAPPGLLVACCFLAAALWIAAGRRGAAGAAALLLVPLVASAAIELSARRVDGLEVTMLDVGQGDAILVRKGRDVLLVDGGGRRGDAAFGRNVLVPLLIDRGVRRIDAVVMTHPDPDHCQGLETVVRLLEPESVWMSSRHLAAPCAARLADASRQRAIPIELVDRRSPRGVASIQVTLFAPEPPFRRSLANNTSLVLRIDEHETSLLLSGDIERPAEFQLLESAPALVPVDVLKVAHHGSRSSTSETFVGAARPRIAMISAGEGNPYGHPAEETVSRLTAAGTRVLRTDLHGTIRLTIRNGIVFRDVEIDTLRRADTL